MYTVVNCKYKKFLLQDGSWHALPLLCFLAFFTVKSEFRKTAWISGMLKSFRRIETLVGLGLFVLTLPFPDTA